MVHCVAYKCKSCSIKKEPNITFHRFPADPEKKYIWIQATKIANWMPTPNDRLCSKHFENHCFYETKCKRRLLNNAVPTIFLELPKYMQIKKVHFEDSQWEKNREDGRILLKSTAVPTLFDVPNLPPRLDPKPRKSLYKEESVLEVHSALSSASTIKSTSDIQPVPQTASSVVDVPNVSNSIAIYTIVPLHRETRAQTKSPIPPTNEEKEERNYMGNMDPNFFHTYATVEGSGSSSDNIVNKPGKYSLDQPEEEPKQMDTDDEKIEVDQICRGCLSMANVHNMQEIFIGGINSVVLYENVSQIKVESENVPAVLCINCTLELEKVDTFIKTLKHSYKVLAKAIEEINRLDKQNVNKYHLKRISILKNALLKGKFSGNFEAKEEANEDHQQLFEAWSEHSADDNFSIHNNSGSSDDEIPLSKRFNTNIKNKQPDTTKTKRINNEETLTKNKKSKDNLENLPDNDSFQLKEVLKCPICSKKIKNYEKHLHSNHHLDWDNSRCLKCPYQNAEKDELLEHSKKCKKSHCKNRALKIEDLELEEKLDSDDSDPEFQAFLKEMKLEDWESKINRSNKNRRPRKKFTCVKCPNVSFRQYKNIESHLKTVHNEESECIICEQEFTNSFSVLHHMMVKHGKLKCCRLCLVSFNNSEELNAHYKSEEHNTKCTVCGEQFKNRKALYEHRRKKHLNPHLENQKYKCPECPKEFANHNNIRRHIMIAHNDVRFLCDTCGQSYTTKRNLRLHILKFHEGVKLQNKNTKKNFFCEACGRELKIFHKYAIAMHRAKHKGHNFVCKICYDSFPTEEVFRRHVEDFGHQLFHCHKCPAEFVRQENYKVHLKNHDVPGWNKNMFATWGKSAKLRNDKGQFVCSYCPKVFKDKQRLDNHIRVHTNERPYKCHICSKGFKTWIHRKTHLNIHLGIKKWVCKYCGKAFTNSCTLKGHEMIHTGERPHRCPECKKGFITMSAMKKHRMVHFRTTASSYGKKDKPNPRDEDKSDSEHEENAEFVYKYESMFAGSEVSYENFAEPPKEVVVPMERELSCRANCI